MFLHFSNKCLYQKVCTCQISIINVETCKYLDIFFNNKKSDHKIYVKHKLRKIIYSYKIVLEYKKI